MTDKKVISLILLPLLSLTLIVGVLVLNSPASAAKETGAPAQTGLSAWNPLQNALATTRGADELAPVASAPAAPEVCTPDITPMLSYWPLDETSGTAFTDVVDGNHGACTEPGCPTPTTGIVEGAQLFNSTEFDGILITEDPLNPLTWGNSDSFSFEAWVNFQSAEDCTGNKVFFGRYRLVNPESQWWIGCTPGGLPSFLLKDNISNIGVMTSGTTAINNGVWHHVVGVRDGGTGENLLYVDGALAASQSVAYVGSFVSTGAITIGKYAANYNLNGLIDEVAVYDKALSLAEVEAHYNAGAGQSYCSEPPVAVDDALATDEGTDLPFTADDLLANDSDPDGTDPTISAIDAASTEGGTITDHLDGTYTYSPPEDFSGSDTFTYTISAGGESDTATVTVTVKAVNDPPVAVDQFVTTDEDAAVAITLGATDVESDPLTFSVVDPPDHGTLSVIVGTDLTYTPEADYYGLDSFTFKANDGTDDSNLATVSITIDAGPEAVDDNLATEENTSLDFTEDDLLVNDSHPEGELFGIAVVDTASAEGGTITDMGGGNYQYSPPADFAGTDSFTYTVEDESGGSDIATVFVTVGVNDAPVAEDQDVSVAKNGEVDITLVATDADEGDTLTYTVVAGPQHGVLTGSGAVRTYTPDTDYTGPDSFTFKVNDGTVDSNVATVTITVTSEVRIFLPMVMRVND